MLMVNNKSSASNEHEDTKP